MIEKFPMTTYAQARQLFINVLANVRPVLDAGDKLWMWVADDSRTLEQNAAQWPILTAFAKQLEWPVNGQMVKMTPEEWKDVLTAAFQGETVRLAMGLNGGVVMLGLRTSEFGKKRFGEWLEFLHATAAMRGVSLDYIRGI